MKKGKENDFTTSEDPWDKRQDDSPTARMWEDAADYFDNMSDEELLQYSAERGENLDIKTLRERLAKARQKLNEEKKRKGLKRI